MSDATVLVASVPQWDRADRMRKALRHADPPVSVQGMADYLGVTRQTVGTWINGHIEPSTQTLRLWALHTGVPFNWLRDGDPTTPPGGGRSEVNNGKPAGFTGRVVTLRSKAA